MDRVLGAKIAEVEFSAKIGPAGAANAAIELSEDLVLSFNAGKRPPVSTTINGVPYRTRVMVYGGNYYLGLRKDIIAASGAAPGTTARVTVRLDTEPRVVKLPPELEAALRQSKPARSSYDALSYSHQREYARWVGEAKKEETRSRRATKAVEMLVAGVKTPDS